MADCAHGYFAPNDTIEALPICQAGYGRHRCPVCAYNHGLAVGRGEVAYEGPSQTCAKRHASAPVEMLRALPISQARLQRHRCSYLAYQRGKEAGQQAIDNDPGLGDDDEISRIRSSTDIEETVKEQLILARRGQGVFRTEVLQLDGRCRLTGISDSRFLRASHINPWRDSTNSERLDKYNGLMLAPHADHLFDGGWLTFGNDGIVQISKHLPNEIWVSLGFDKSADARPFHSSHHQYLAHHRTKIFKLE